MTLSVDVAALGTGRRTREFDVVVIGSGYGAGVLAARLATTPLSIAVLERGRELTTAEFPSHGRALRRETQIHDGAARLGSPLGMFDIRLNPELAGQQTRIENAVARTFGARVDLITPDAGNLGSFA